MESTDRESIVRELNKKPPGEMGVFNEGKDAGSKGLTSPQLKEISSKISNGKLDPQDISFLKGYTEGMLQLLQRFHFFSQEISNLELGPGIIRLDLLDRFKTTSESFPPDPSGEFGFETYYAKHLIPQDLLLGYLKGLEREKPDISREASEKACYSEEVSAYRVGFIVGIVRDFGINHPRFTFPSEIPTNDASYDAFTDGLRGRPRASFGQMVATAESSNDVIGLPEIERENAYKTGLKIWLLSNHQTSVKVGDIRDPGKLINFIKQLKLGRQGEKAPFPPPPDSNYFLNKLVDEKPKK